MPSPLPNLIATEQGKGLEMLRNWNVELSHAAATSQSLSKPVGPSDVDLDVRSIWITPGAKPTANAGNLLEVWLGAPGITADVQTVTITATGGTIRYGFAGVYTTALAFNATTGTIQTAIRLLPAINGANINVSGSASAPVFTFAGVLDKENMPLIQLDTSALTGGSATIVHTTPGVGQRLISRQVDANFTANTPVNVAVGQAPHGNPRIPAGTCITVAMTMAGDDSTTPTTLNVRINVEIPYYDQSAKLNNQGSYNRSV